MRSIFLFFIFSLLQIAAFSQDSLLISYYTKIENTAFTDVQICFYYDTLHEYLFSERLQKISEKHFEKKIKVPKGVYYAIAAFHEKSTQFNTVEDASVSGDVSGGKVHFVSVKSNAVKKYKILQNGDCIPAHLRIYCTETDLINQLQQNQNDPRILGDFFYCLLQPESEKQDSIPYFFEKYASDAIPRLQLKEDLASLFSLAVLQLVQKNEAAYFETCELVKQKFPTCYKLSVLHNLGTFHFNKRRLIEDRTAHLKKHHFFNITQEARANELMKPVLTFDLPTALKVHEHFVKAYQFELTWQEYAEKTKIFEAYSMSDTVYHRSIEILKQKKNGSFIENPSMGEIIKSGHWAINIISYEAKKGNYQNAKIYNNPFYFQLIPFYEQLHEVYKRYALGFAHRKANIHLALNEKDSALQVYTELAKLTQADTIFDKIKAVYLEIHGSDSAYKDFLKKNGIDKFHKEKKYAPNAEFLMYGNDEKINIESLRGKVVVLNFWGTYCKPCIKEMPDLNNLKLRYLPEKDLVFIAPTKDDAAKLKSFFKNKKFDYQIAYTSEEVFKAFNVSFIPVNMVINRKGEIIFEESGAYQDTLLKLNRAIEEALYSR